jgi:hypothetical protein
MSMSKGGTGWARGDMVRGSTDKWKATSNRSPSPRTEAPVTQSQVERVNNPVSRDVNSGRGSIRPVGTRTAGDPQTPDAGVRGKGTWMAC